MYIPDASVPSGGFGAFISLPQRLPFDVRDMCPAGTLYAGDLNCVPTSGAGTVPVIPSGLAYNVNVEACTADEIKILNYCVPVVILGLLGAVGLVLVVR